MLILGHAGITLGAAIILAGTVKNSPVPAASRRDWTSWLIALGNHIDIRLLLIGSLLPDIIDKPVGQLFFRETFSQGRIFSHTLLFLVLISLAGGYLYQRYSKNWLLVLSFGTFMHLLLDQMWRVPQTLFWPLLGIAFARIELADWLPGIFSALLTNPAVYVPELVGAAVLLYLGLMLVRRKKTGSFIKSGRLS